MPRRNRKKKGQRNKKPAAQDDAPPKKPEVDLNTIMKQADAASEASDIPTALSLYEYIANALRSKLNSSSDVNENENGEKDETSDETLLLASVLSKLGEAKVSMGDGEGGKTDFLEAITLLGGEQENNDENVVVGGVVTDDAEMGDSTPMMQDEEEHEIHKQQQQQLSEKNCSSSGNAMEVAQQHEMKAGLHLYVGQLSSEQEALKAFRSGVREWEKCVQVLEGIDQNMGDGKDEDMERGEEEEQVSPGEALVEAKRQLIGAHCSIAELFMTDLCYEPDAESQCEQSLQTALSLDSKNSSSTKQLKQQPQQQPDALQTMANLRLSQNRGSEAVQYMLDAYERMKVGVEAMASLVGLGKDDADGDCENKMVEGEERQLHHVAKELVDVDAASSLPGFEFRCQSAKLLLECASVLDRKDDEHDNDDDDDDEHNTMTTATTTTATENEYSKGTATDKQAACIEASIQLLGSLLSENDEVVEVWYLLGVAFMAGTPPNSDEARFYWEKALEMLYKVKEEMEQAVASSGSGEGEGEEEEIKEQLEEITCQIEEINEKLVEVGEIDRCNMTN